MGGRNSSGRIVRLDEEQDAGLYNVDCRILTFEGSRMEVAERALSAAENNFKYPLDKYIVIRYITVTIYRTTIYRPTKEAVTMAEQMALTESTYYILLSLYRPQHGYGIMQQTEALSGGRVRLAAGTLYGALNTLCDKGWIIQLPVDNGSRRKEYRLTEKGFDVLAAEVTRLRELADNGERILGEG